MIDANFISFPVLTTDRMILRELQLTDDKESFLLRADAKVNKYLEGYAHTSIEQTQVFIRKIRNNKPGNDGVYWVMTLKANHQFIGTICLWNVSKEENKAEIGYTLHPDFHGQGYMYEALHKVLDFGFNQMKLSSIEAYTHRENEPSAKLLLKSNFKLDENHVITDGRQDIVFSLRAEDFEG
jgi:ribosomal-protein-alanine N-acetyltransferase